MADRDPNAPLPHVLTRDEVDHLVTQIEVVASHLRLLLVLLRHEGKKS